MITTTRALALAAIAVVGLVLGLGVASAGAGIANTPVVNPTTVQQGGTFTVSGNADCTETLLLISVRGLGLNEEVDGSSDWSVEFTAPADAEPGTYLIEVTENECPFGDTNVVITAAPALTTTSTSTTVPAAVEAATAPSFTG